jgi:hypothetical protein
MKALISLVLIIAAYLFVKAVIGQFRKDPPTDKASQTAVMEGLPPELEASLATAQAQGAPALRESLER